MAHYFDSTGTKSEEKLISVNFLNSNVKFYSDNAVFSKNELDMGSCFLIEEILKLNISTKKKCLDLGCGIGVIGILLNKNNKNLEFDFVDINSRAVNLTQKNLQLHNQSGNVKLSNCLDEVLLNKYDIVISNPPIRAGNKILDKMFLQTIEVLNTNGSFICVFRYKQGAKTYINRLTNIFKNANILNKAKGFVVCEFKKTE